MNSIVAGNSAQAADNVAGFFSPGGGANLLAGNPLLAPLADYGGPTPTMPPLPGSPVIDAAVPLPGTPSTDQRGAPRPVGPRPDLGAVEAFALSTLALRDSDGDGIDDCLEPVYHLSVGVDDSGCDSDGDGSCDAEEIANMTDPLDPNSRLRILSFTPLAEVDERTGHRIFEVAFNTFPGLSYALECAQDLNFSGPQARVYALGTATGFTFLARMPLLPGRDFVRVRRDP